ncbi:MAG TPA: hypothetical protein VIR31_06125 [Nitrososphaeraceae archaeon]
MVYVVNSRGNTVSVINATNHNKTGNDIQVGNESTAIGIEDPNTV